MARRHPMPDRRVFLAALGLAALSVGGLFLPPRPALAGESILTVTTDADKRSFDLAALDALPQTTFSTKTPWQGTSAAYSGVRLADLLAASGAGNAHHLRFVALNDYEVEGEVAMLVGGDALLATRKNGVPMPVEDKGPVFVVFPFDSRPELHHQSFFSRTVWQLSEIEALD